jgi:hypothetical protein
MLLSNKIDYYLRNSHFNIKYPKLSNFILYINNIIYLLSITMCINILFNNMLLPFFTKIFTIVKGFWNGFVHMMSSSKGNSAGNSTPPTPNSNPNPNSGGNSNVIKASSRKKSDKNNKKEIIKEFEKSATQSEIETRDAYAKLKKGIRTFYRVEQKGT